MSNIAHNPRYRVSDYLGWEGDFISAPPAFVAEILSPSTADKDRNAKRALYESQGVNSYLIVDPETQECELLILGPDRTYRSADPATPIQLHPGCQVHIEAARLW